MTTVPSNSRGPVFSAIHDLTAAELAALGSSSVVLVPAQGLGSGIVPVSASFQYAAGTVPFADTANVRVAAGAVFFTITNLGLDTLNDAARAVAGYSIQSLDATEDLVVNASAAIGFLGPILTVAVDSAGLLYAVNDTGTVDGGSTLATYKVLTVGGGGTVTSVQITSAGQGYAAGVEALTTVVTGSGDGTLTLDILTVGNGSNGTGRVEVLYYLLPLS